MLYQLSYTRMVIRVTGLEPATLSAMKNSLSTPRQSNTVPGT